LSHWECAIQSPRSSRGPYVPGNATVPGDTLFARSRPRRIRRAQHTFGRHHATLRLANRASRGKDNHDARFDAT